MTKGKSFVHIDGDTWCALYMDGKSVFQNHSVTLKDFYNVAKYKFGDSPWLIGDIKFEYADADWLYERGAFPENLADVKLLD